MKKMLRIYAVTLCLVGFFTVSAFGQKKEKEKSVTEQKVQTAYDKFISQKGMVKVGNDLMKLYFLDGKVYAEISERNFYRPFILSATIARLSDPQLNMVGQECGKPLFLQVVPKGDVFVLEEINPDFDMNVEGTTAPAIDKNYGNTTFSILYPKLFNDDNTSFITDVTSMFERPMRNFPEIARTSGIQGTPYMNANRILSIKGFKKNISITAEHHYKVNIPKQYGKSEENSVPALVEVNYSILSLPDELMTPRIADTRVGLYHTTVLHYNNMTQKIEPVDFAQRWNLLPKDSVAYVNGKLSEPKQPIVFYIDDAFPQQWMKPIERAVERWNNAFEKIGFKNVMQAKPYPKNENFDPDDAQYNCIRYVPSTQENAMGKIQVDPRTGEIIKANVFIYGNVVNLLNTWRFTQTAQIDKDVRKGRLPRKQMEESLEYVIAHELGHTLGFLHNMAASAAYPTDSLRSAKFTKKYGTTPSIMDYARFNYVAQPSDKGVSLTPPKLGAYDYMMVDWAYRYFPEAGNDMFKVQQNLDSLMRGYEKQPLLRYVYEQTGRTKYDATALEEDLGKDAIKAADYGLKNIKYISNGMQHWMGTDVNSQKRTYLYQQLANQAFGYIGNVYTLLGGLEFNNMNESVDPTKYKVINKEIQRKAALWLLNRALDFASLSNESMEKEEMVLDKPFALFAAGVQQMAVGGMQRVETGYYFDKNSYSPQEYAEDVFTFVFAPSKMGKALTEAEKQLQNAYVEQLCDIFAPANNGGSNRYGLRNLQTETKRLCIEELYPIAFGVGYGNVDNLYSPLTDDVKKYSLLYGEQSKVLLKGLLQNVSNDDKEHYAYLLHRLEKCFPEDK